MNQSNIHRLFNKYFEITAFSAGLLLLAFMDPETVTGPDLCLFDLVGIPFCPGEGLGHSIAYLFEGDFSKSLEANILGPFAIFILGRRIGSLAHQKLNFFKK